MNPKQIAIVYIPVLHQGYLNYLDVLQKEGVATIYLVGDDILASHEELDYINRKDRMRAVPHETMKRVLSQVTNLAIESLTMSVIMGIDRNVVIHSPREDINLFLIDTYFGGYSVKTYDVFVRRNRENLGEEHEPKTDRVPLTDFLKDVVKKGEEAALKSADWWRQVGAVLMKEGVIISVAHNEHMPEEELPNIIGDARSLFKKKDHIDYMTAVHAEAAVIADMAKRGESTLGTELFVTDFPCPYCARIIAKAGIKKLYYKHGYAVLGGDELFRELGVEMVKIEK